MRLNPSFALTVALFSHSGVVLALQEPRAASLDSGSPDGASAASLEKQEQHAGAISGSLPLYIYDLVQRPIASTLQSTGQAVQDYLGGMFDKLKDKLHAAASGAGRTGSEGASSASQAQSTAAAPSQSGQKGKVNIGYFTNWGVYGNKYFPYDIPLHSLTHVLYAFADVSSDSGAVKLTDAWADEQMRYTDPASGANPPLDTWNDDGGGGGEPQLYGALKRFALLKRENRRLKLMLSIGGWTFSSHFWPSMSTQEGRECFARSAVGLLEDYGFDGLDIDWEYPQNAEQARALTELLRTVRRHLDEAAGKRSGGARVHFPLTIACPAAPDKISTLDVKGMDPLLDYWNLMLYDFAGSWSSVSGHQANLYPSQSSEASGDAAIRAYLSAGATRSKLVYGLPLYGRQFAQTGGLGQPFEGTGEGGLGGGSWNLKDLPHDGARVVQDAQAGASYCYDERKRTLTSFDTRAVFEHKADYIQQQGLAGAMYWELGGDYPKQGSARGQPVVPIVAGKVSRPVALGRRSMYVLGWQTERLTHHSSSFARIRPRPHRNSLASSTRRKIASTIPSPSLPTSVMDLHDQQVRAGARWNLLSKQASPEIKTVAYGRASSFWTVLDLCIGSGSC